MAYDIMPGVDETYNFPLPVQKAFIKTIKEGDNRMQAAIIEGSLNEYKRPGVYPVANNSVTDRPVSTYGTLDVTNPTGGRTLQVFTTAEISPRIFTRFAYQDNWQPWVRSDGLGGYKGLVSANTDMNDLTDDGVYGVAGGASGFDAMNFKNLPVKSAGILEAARLGIACLQRYTTLPGSLVDLPEVYVRRVNVSKNFAGPWANITTHGVDVGRLQLRKQFLLQDLSARKGGRIGLDGKAAIALRFDDAPTEFENIALPLLKKYQMPFTRVTTSKAIYTVSHPDGIFDRMQAYSLENGGEVWNHGEDHNELNGYDDVERKVVQALGTLQSSMPKLKIDCFSSPGDGYNWNGHFPVTSINAFTDNYTGQVVANYHAISSGYFDGGLYRPLDGVVRDGLRAFSADGGSVQYMRNVIDRNISNGSGSVFMYHANKMNAEILEDTLKYLSEKRASGELEVLTVSGLSFADYLSSARRNYFTVSTGSSVGVNLPEINRRLGIPGSTMMVSFKSTESSVVVSINGSDRTVQPVNGYFATHFTIPTDATSLKVDIKAAVTEARLVHV